MCCCVQNIQLTIILHFPRLTGLTLYALVIAVGFTGKPFLLSHTQRFRSPRLDRKHSHRHLGMGFVRVRSKIFSKQAQNSGADLLNRLQDKKDKLKSIFSNGHLDAGVGGNHLCIPHGTSTTVTG